jgi:hypothetical protein
MRQILLLSSVFRDRPTRRYPLQSAYPLACMIVALALAAARAAIAAAPATLQLSQVLSDGPALVAYVAVRDEGGDVVSGIGPRQIHATVGAEVADVEGFTSFAEAGEGVTYLFLVDVSQSIVGPRFEQMRASLREWVAALGPADRAALITFGSQVRTLLAPTADRAALNAAIDTLAPTDRHTQLHAALLRALDLSRQRSEGLPRRRAIVVLSDGLDDAQGGPSAGEVLARMAEEAAPIYAIGFSGVRDRSRREAALAALGRFARQSGGSFADAGGGSPAPALEAMRRRIQEVYRAELQCARCVWDGNRYRVQIALSTDGLTLSDGTDVRLYPIGVSPGEGGAETRQRSERGPPTAEQGAGTAREPEAEQSPSDSEAAGAAGATPDSDREGQAGDAHVPQVRAPGGWVYAGAAVALLVGLLAVFVMLRARRRHLSSPADGKDPTEGGTCDGAADAPVPPPEVTAVLDQPPPPVAAGRIVHLTSMRGAERGREVPLTLAPAAVLGRDADCTLALPEDERVSARHAQLILEGDQVLLQDLESTNKTFLNGVAIHAPHPVDDGDLIRIGRSEFRIRLEQDSGE